MHLDYALRAGDEFVSDVAAIDDAHGLVIFRCQPAHTYQKSEFRIVAVSAIVGEPTDLGPSPDASFSPRRVESAEVKQREAEGEARCVTCPVCASLAWNKIARLI